MASYVKFCERTLDIDAEAFFDAEVSGGMSAEVADFATAYYTSLRCYRWAVQEEDDAYDYYMLQEELERQGEAWADHDYATYIIDLDDCYPAWRYDDIGPGYRGRIAA